MKQHNDDFKDDVKSCPNFIDEEKNIQKKKVEPAKMKRAMRKKAKFKL